MSVNYRAKLVYGVLLTEQEYNKMFNLPNYDDIQSSDFVHYADRYNGPYPNSVILGICTDDVWEGENTEICVNTPTCSKIDEVLDVLDSIDVDREPTWHLLCEVS